MKKINSLFLLLTILMVNACSILDSRKKVDVIAEPYSIKKEYKYYAPEQLLDTAVLRLVLESDSVFADTSSFKTHLRAQIKNFEHLHKRDIIRDKKDSIRHEANREFSPIEKLLYSSAQNIGATDFMAKLDTIRNADYVSEYNLKQYRISIDSIQDILDGNFFSALTAARFKSIKRRDSLVRSQRNWLIGIISSEAYMKRLSNFTSDFSARRLQQVYLSRLNDGEYYFSNHPYHSWENAFGHLNKKRGVFIGYKPNRSLDLVALHEFEHQANVGRIPRQIKSLLKNTFSERKFINYFGNSDYVSYFSAPTEILARKRVLDYELEFNGIKRYEEDFTIEHYHNIQMLRVLGDLSSCSREILHLFEMDDLIYIMNTVP